jgi:hypothetical protein
MLSRLPRESAISSTVISALLISNDPGLARDLLSAIRRLELPVHLIDTAPARNAGLLAPDLLFIDAEGEPGVLGAARLQYPAAKQIAIVGHWSETEAEVRGFVDWTLHKPLRNAELLALQRLFRTTPDRLIA